MAQAATSRHTACTQFTADPCTSITSRAIHRSSTLCTATHRCSFSTGAACSNVCVLHFHFCQGHIMQHTTLQVQHCIIASAALLQGTSARLQCVADTGCATSQEHFMMTATILASHCTYKTGMIQHDITCCVHSIWSEAIYRLWPLPSASHQVDNIATHIGHFSLANQACS